MPARRLLVLLLLAWLAVPARAQQPPQFEPPVGADGWLTGHNFVVGLDKMHDDDSRYEWDFDIGGSVDLLRAGPARVNFLVNYESILGEQLQRFDPIFNNYTIDVSGGARWRGVEWLLRFHHISRHLGDREKRFGIAWNMLGPQVNWRRSRPGLDVQVRAWALGTVAWYWVDYAGELGTDAIVERPVHPRLSLVGRGYVHRYLIAGDRSFRHGQTGGRAEAAVRLNGRGAAAELYVAIDRRIDADPLEQVPVTWGLAGLRFLTLPR